MTPERRYATAIGLIVTGIVLVACRGNPSVIPIRPKPVDVNVVTVQYVLMQQTFEQEAATIQAQLLAANTTDQIRAAYAAAAAAEHRLNTGLLALPLFPTVMKADWKSLLKANRQMEIVYTQLSLTSTAADPLVASQNLAPARAALATSERRFRNDLMLPVTVGLVAP